MVASGSSGLCQGMAKAFHVVERLSGWVRFPINSATQVFGFALVIQREELQRLASLQA